MKKTVRGELTVFLSFIFLFLLTLVGAVIESASIQVAKNEKRADAGRAAESIFAEYQKDLLEQYGIFALDGSYESGYMSEKNVLNRLSFYGAENMDIDILSIRYITDNNGQEFYRQAVTYQKIKMGISVVEDVLDKQQEWEEKELLSGEYDEEESKTNTTLNNLLQDENLELSENENPLELLKTLKSEMFLDLILPKEFVLSEHRLNSDTLLNSRRLQKGYGSLPEQKEENNDAVFFNLYLLEKFGNAVEKKEGTLMQYELEYLLEGGMSDMGNLEGVLRSLCNVRFGINYAYLLSDQTMQAEAEALAGTLSIITSIPAVTPVLKQAILLAWSYGEAMMDVRTLLEGGEVPLIKSKNTWKLSLEYLLNLEKNGLPSNELLEEDGMTYKEYLQMLLMMKNQKILRMRALSLIEQNIANLEGNGFFKLDHCITGARFQMDCLMRRNVKYQFQISYQYH